MGSVNILIADHSNACAFFLKSILKSQGFGISLALNRDETLAKLSTGLFDAVLCDFDLDASASQTLIGEINEMLPGLPVVVIYSSANKRIPAGDLFCGIDKPLLAKQVIEVMTRVKNTVTSLDNRRQHPRREVNLPAELNAGGRTIFCRATNLSAGGMQVETLNRARVRRGLEALFRERRSGPIRAKLFLGGHKVWEFKTNLAYIERFRFHQPEQVGLSFTEMNDRQKSELETFLVAN
ncbi:MAG: PilZ domain-containing protein [Planctomycetota bacterium]|jgi:DNA-binding response OmpR family regulator